MICLFMFIVSCDGEALLRAGTCAKEPAGTARLDEDIELATCQS